MPKIDFQPLEQSKSKIDFQPIDFQPDASSKDVGTPFSPMPDIGDLKAGLESYGNALTSGYLPQLQAGAQKITDPIFQKLTGQKVEPEEYVKSRDENIARQQQESDQGCPISWHLPRRPAKQAYAIRNAQGQDPRNRRPDFPRPSLKRTPARPAYRSGVQEIRRPYGGPRCAPLDGNQGQVKQADRRHFYG